MQILTFKLAPKSGSLLLLMLLAISVSINVVNANKISNKKLINKFETDPKTTPKLIHSQFSSGSVVGNNHNNIVTSIREEWYQDDTGKIWYTWEEKHPNTDGLWEAVNYGMAKQGFRGFVSIP